MFWVLKRTVSPFREDFIFAKLRICEVSRKLNPRENFQICSMSKLVEVCNDLKIRNMYCARFGRGIHKFCVFGRKYCVLGVVADV